MLAFPFDELDLHRIEADVDPRNIRSVALLEQLGFKREGHLRERWHVNGEICDGLFDGLLRHEGRAVEPSLPVAPNGVEVRMRGAAGWSTPLAP